MTLPKYDYLVNNITRLRYGELAACGTVQFVSTIFVQISRLKLGFTIRENQ